MYLHLHLLVAHFIFTFFYAFLWHDQPARRMIHEPLNSDPRLDHPVAEIGRVAKAHGTNYVEDAMSSFGGLPIDLEDCGIDF